MSLTLNFQSDSLSASSGTLSLSTMTGSINLPKGNTSARPVTPVAGMLRFNTDTNIVEFFNGSIWTSNAQVGGITGPNTTTANAVALWAGNSGGSIQNSLVVIDGSGNISGVLQLNANNINATGTNLVLQTTTSGNILINPVVGGTLILQGNVWPTTPGTSGQAISTNGAGTLSFQTYLQPANNLSDVANPITSLTNLGGKKFKGCIFLNANNAIDPTFCGKLAIVNTTGITITLPQLSTLVDGQEITFVCAGATNATINTFTGDKISWTPTYINGSSITINNGDVVVAAVNASGPEWRVASCQSPGFPQSVVVGAPTGGNQGSGSINAQAIYINGTALQAGGGFITPYAIGAYAFALTAYGPGVYSGSVLYNPQPGSWRQLDYVLTYNDGHGGIRWITMFQRIA